MAEVPLERAVAALRARPDFGNLGARFARQCSKMQMRWFDAVAAQVPAWRESRAPDIHDELACHGRAIAADICDMLSSAAVGEFAFVREFAHARAAHFFPLEAVLHTYRCLQRVLVHQLREITEGTEPVAIALLDDLVHEYVDAISVIAGAAYAEHAKRRADTADDERSTLLDLLLEGHDEADPRVADRLREGGFLDRRLEFCVVIARSVDPSHMRDAARARRLADTLDDLLPQSLARRVVGVRTGQVVIILAAIRRQSGWTAPYLPLSTRVATELALAGNDVLIGIGPDVEATGQIPLAHRRAVLAQRLAHVGERVRLFECIPLREFVLQQAASAVSELLPTWRSSFEEADRRLGGALNASLRAYAASNLNMLRTAARLTVHPNTLYARFARIQEITVLNPREYRSLETLLLVLDLTTLPPR